MLKNKETETLNVLDMDQWEFFVLSKNEVKKITKNGGSLSLKTLEKTEIKQIHFKDLKNTIAKCL